MIGRTVPDVPTGRVSRVTAPDGSFLDYAYDTRQRVTSVTNNAGEKVEYSYNADSQVTSSVVKSSSNAIVKQMSATYDEMGKLLKAIGAGGQETAYTYNRTDQVTQVKDPRNNLYGYAYDGLSRLIRETDEVNAEVNYGLDAQGDAFELMVSRSSSHPGVPTGTVHYIYDTDGHLIAEANAATGATTREYIWLPSNDNSPVDLPIAIAEAGAIYHVHADHLGRPIRMTNGSKTTVWAATWKPWGEVQSISGTLANTLRFPGQYFQIETNLHYNWHRHYDPVTGRYTQPDPLGFVNGPSLYAYAKSSPYMHTDRDGQFARVIARFLIRKIMNAIRLCQKRPRLCSAKTLQRLYEALNKRLNWRGPSLASIGGSSTDNRGAGGDGSKRPKGSPDTFDKNGQSTDIAMTLKECLFLIQCLIGGENGPKRPPIKPEKPPITLPQDER